MKIDYDKALVTKANSLIEASYKLSVNEQKLILMLTASVKKEDKEFYPYTISAKKLANVLGLENKNIYKDIAKLVRGLQKKTLTIEKVMKTDKKKLSSTLNINWLSSSEYFHGEGRLELCFDPKLKPYLLNLKKCFTSYQFREIAQLKSRFAIRIYELLKQYQSFSSRIFTIEKLRNILDIEPTQYHPYFNFKNKVILVAQKELEKKGSFSFDFEEIKEGRKVTKIRFIIKKQAVREQLHFPVIRDIEESSEEPRDSEKVLELIPDSYKTKASIKKLIQTYLEKFDYDYVVRNVEYANEKSNAIKPGRNLAKRSNYRSYLKKSLENDFGLSFKEDREISQEEEEARKQRKLKEEQEKIAVEADKAQKEEMDELIKQYIEKLKPADLKKLEEDAIEAMTSKEKDLVGNKKTGWKILLKVKVKELVRLTLS